MRSVMRANPRRDTKPERRLRSLLHGMGLRYRVDRAPLPGIRRRADLVFPRAKVVVFVDGCFWHGCPQHYRPARKNAEFWDAKLLENTARDRETDQLLSASGWRVIRVWEHEDMPDAAERIYCELRARVR
nr:very short patch repair endonuclease [Mycobacterium sp. 1245805.9]